VVPPAAHLADLVPPDVDLDTGTGLRHGAAVPVWFGVVWGRLGRGDLAWAQWERVRLPALQPWIAAERGRLLRELGDHAAAEAREWPALLAAEDPVDQAMLRISLAADAVGRADVATASRRLDGALATLDDAPASPRRDRQQLRAAWVGVEVALLAGVAPEEALLPRLAATGEASAEAMATGVATGVTSATGEASATGEPSAARPTALRVHYPPAYAAGTRFHRAKGCLFAAVVRRDRRLLVPAAELAPPALAWAVDLALADLAAADGDVEGSARARRRGLAARDAIVPPPVRRR
jgi:hypothetical protein